MMTGDLHPLPQIKAECRKSLMTGKQSVIALIDVAIEILLRILSPMPKD
jgi:hypothetical protein